MLRHTFCHMPGIGLTTERRLWEGGIRRWEDVLRDDARDKLAGKLAVRGQRAHGLARGVAEAIEQLDRGDLRYFAQRLPSGEQWRLFQPKPESRATGQRVGYLDIETTGLGGPSDHVTTIALYDGASVRHYVYGRNLHDFEQDVNRCDLLVTYNGKSFDLPFLRKQMGVDLPQAHIDLMHVLRRLGYRGGLKSIERQLGLGRADMADVDGYTAVLLWHAFEQSGDERVLETLLAYNVQDVLTLEPLMVFAFNKMVAATPFVDGLREADRGLAGNPFTAHRDVIDELKRPHAWS